MKLQILKSAVHLVSLLFITTISFPMASHGNSSYISISDPVVNQPLRYYDFGVPSPNADLMKKSAWKSLCIDTTRTLGERLCLPVTTRTSELSDTILYTVGQIQYEESVSSTGARTYIVPIKVSDNAVFPPSLSLCYNSQASDGIAGYGWTIGGISSIEIIHKNVYYHGEVAPADVNDSSSVYAFDGIPLVTNDSPTTMYEYPLKTIQGQILIKKHMSGSIVSYFTALYPDGSKATLGNVSNTSSQSCYPITKKEDRNGNVINYSYANSNNRYRITAISYKHNGYPVNIGQITFTYSLRKDKYVRYIAGERTSEDYILTSISSLIGSRQRFLYTLEHEFRERAYLLTSIGCKNQNNECLRPLQFFYENRNPQNGDFAHTDYMMLSDAFNSSSFIDFIYNRGKLQADSYNDGLVIFPSFPTYAIVEIAQQYKRYGSSYNPAQPILIAPEVSYFSAVDQLTVGNGFQSIGVIDTDCDGQDEIIRVNFMVDPYDNAATRLDINIYDYTTEDGLSLKNSFPVRVYGVVQDGPLISPMLRTYLYGDFRGDGKAQLLTISLNKDFKGYTRTSYAAVIDLDTGLELSELNFLSLSEDDCAAGRLFCADMDSDGKTELCHLTSSGLNIYNLSGRYFTLTRTISDLNSKILSSPFHLADFNCDGYADIVAEPEVGNTSLNVYMYDGHNFHHSSQICSMKSAGDELLFFDVNNDNLTDLIHKKGQSLFISINNNARLSSPFKSSISISAFADIIPSGWMGYKDMADFYIVDDAYLHMYNFTQDLVRGRLITGFKNSMKVQTFNRYENMARYNYVYMTDTARQYPDSTGYFRRSFPMYLLQKSQKFLDETYTTLLQSTIYTYYDAVMHKMGRGFCGFGKVETYNENVYGGFGEMTVNIRAPERMGITLKLEKRHSLSWSEPFHEVLYTYDNYFTQYGKLSPRLTKIEDIDTVSTINSVTNITYDSYGCPTLIRTERTSNNKGRKYDIREYVYKHRDSTDIYILGTVEYSTQTFMTPWIEQRGISSDQIFFSDTLATFLPINPIDRNSYWIVKKRYFHDDIMRPVSRIDSIGSSPDVLVKDGESLWTYSNCGNMLSELYAPRNVLVFRGKTYSYDISGTKLISCTDASGRKVILGNHHMSGNPGTATDSHGRVTELGYDAWGRHILTRHPDGTEDSIALFWSDIGIYGEEHYVTGNPSSIKYRDGLGRLIRESTLRFDGQWMNIDKEYCSAGLKRESLPFTGNHPDKWSVYEYDRYGRIVSYLDASGADAAWSYIGNTVTETKNGISSSRTFDSRGEVYMVSDLGGTVNYDLRANGQPECIKIEGGGTIEFEYDAYGKRSRLTDSGAGIYADTVEYAPDGSSVAMHVNPNGKICIVRDTIGRVTRIERDGEFTTDCCYDDEGKLVSTTSSNGTVTVFIYDSLGRLSIVHNTVPDGMWLKRTYGYTADSNVSSVTYESQYGVITTEEYIWDNGHNVGIIAAGQNIKMIMAENAIGQPTRIRTGNVIRAYSYDSSGYPLRRSLGNVMDVTYGFDTSKGILTHRIDNRRRLAEHFSYDSLNRLTELEDRMVQYSSIGNITSIDGVGDMLYSDQNNPYIMTEFIPDGELYRHDCTIQYTSFNRPASICNGKESATFVYDDTGNRVKMSVIDEEDTILTRYYIGQRYELEITPSDTVERLYLGGNAYDAPMVYIRSNGEPWILYNIGRDYLGSITHVTTMDGVLVEENSYDAWGRLRDPYTIEVYETDAVPTLTLGRGFTGHEHLPWFGLINMNARLYDPLLGRFLSPDPYVQIPDFTQSYNRYAYCLNNPLIYIDESGEYFIIDSFLVGILSGRGWDKAMQMAKNDLRIWGGLFVSDSNKSLGGRIWEVGSRFLWQPLQTLGGFLTAHTFNTYMLFGGVENVDYLYGSTVVNTYGDGKDFGFAGVTQGSFIVGDNGLKSDPANILFQHEYGHYIQSQNYGYLYYGKFGIPSLLSKGNHSYNPVEQDANIRSVKYYYENGLYYSFWDADPETNIIVGYDNNLSFNALSNQNVLKNLISLNWYDMLNPFLVGGLINAFVINSKY